MSSPTVPTPPAEPDDGYNPTWDPDTFPDAIGGVVEGRTTLKFAQPRGERTTFEKLVIQTPDGELVDVLGGRAGLARLITKHDPQVGDAIAISAFGKNEKGAYQYSMSVIRSGPDPDSLLDAEPSEAAKKRHRARRTHRSIASCPDVTDRPDAEGRRGASLPRHSRATRRGDLGAEVEARLLRDESTEKYERLENLDRERELIRARIERLERDPETD